MYLHPGFATCIECLPMAGYSETPLAKKLGIKEGSRVAVVLFGEVRVFHRPHPSPSTDKGAVASIRKWLEQHGVEP